MKYIFLLAFIFTVFVIQAKPLDSLRVETIKGSKFIIHKVDKEETLSAIVKRYKANNAEVVKANNLKDNKVEKGDLLKIPFIFPDSSGANSKDSSRVDEAHANAQSQEVQKISFHTVVAGETINAVAKKYKLTPAQITKWNSLKSNKLVANQVLIVDESAAIKPYVRLNGPEAQMPQQLRQPEFAKADMIEQTGMAIFNETMQVAHAEAPAGTIIKVINLDNNMQCLVKVTDKLDAEKYNNIIITIGNEARKKLNANDATIRVKLIYLQKP